MRRLRSLDLVLISATTAALVVVAAAALRYGDVYVIGDSEHRRTTTADAMRILVPALIAVGCGATVALRRLAARPLGEQWRAERALLRAARGG